MRRPALLSAIHLIFLLFLLLAGCEETATEPGKARVPVPEDRDEAELVVLQLTGSLHAPPDLVDRVAQELQQIRHSFSVAVPEVVRIRHRAPWSPSGLLLLVDEPTARAIRNDEYTAWDELNQTHGLVEVDDISRIDVLHLKFATVAHPCRLAELYGALPGVLQAEPNGWIGDGPNVYAREEGGVRTYLFRDAHGDCPAGCIVSEYWFFEAGDGGPTMIGTWDPAQNPTPPAWWSRARRNVDDLVAQCHK